MAWASACGDGSKRLAVDAGGDPVADAAPVCEPPPPDEDGDFISDEDERRQQNADTDEDGTPDYLDDDSDGDGIPDSQEAGDDNLCTKVRDTDDDGIPDFREEDADNNCVLDADEPDEDLDGDGYKAFQDEDDDGDNLYDTEEWGDDCENPVDFDEDGTPDYLDTDSDDDTIPDLKEGVLDPDGDMLPAYQDVDADGDCIGDALEAGPNPEAPIDTDADGVFDFLDIDADNDGLPDEQEDANCNGVLDDGESSPTETDTDGDGYPDVVEWAAGTNPNDDTSVLDPDDFFFVLPYFDPEEQDDLDFQTDIIKADVQISMDTTGSMGGAVGDLQSTLSWTIIPAAAEEVPDIAFGANTFEDFPVSPFGSNNSHTDDFPEFPHDMPFRLYQRITTNVADAQAGVDALTLGFGADGPESGLEAMYQIATGEGIEWTVTTAGAVPKFNPLNGFDEALGHGMLGGVGFRVGALPIIVHITDIEWHEHTDYVTGGIEQAHSRAQAVAAMVGLGARMIGITSSATARTQLEQVARDTSAMVPPEAWDGGALCMTGSGGGPLPPDPSGLCPLVFGMDYSGTGVTDSLVDGIKALVTFGTIDISGLPVADPFMLPDVDTSAFITAVDPVPPAPPGSSISGNAFIDVQPGAPVRFRVHARNTTVQHTREAQLFTVTIRVMGDGVTTLDEREVFIIVPGGGIDP